MQPAGQAVTEGRASTETKLDTPNNADRALDRTLILGLFLLVFFPLTQLTQYDTVGSVGWSGIRYHALDNVPATLPPLNREWSNIPALT